MLVAGARRCRDSSARATAARWWSLARGKNPLAEKTFEQTHAAATHAAGRPSNTSDSTEAQKRHLYIHKDIRIHSPQQNYIRKPPSTYHLSDSVSAELLGCFIKPALRSLNGSSSLASFRFFAFNLHDAIRPPMTIAPTVPPTT
jgi:hypothetical protein